MYFLLALLFSYHDCLIAVSQHNPHGREFGAGWSSPVARQAHNLKVAGSNPAPATIKSPLDQRSKGFFLRGQDFKPARVTNGSSSEIKLVQ